MIKKAVMLLLCLPLAHITLATQAIAEEINITVTGNGSESSNSVNTSTQSTTTVTQENNAEITNNVSQDLNTGGNDANLNNGDTAISTGNIDSSTSVSNNNINTNNVSVDNCCDSSTNIKVSGNGSVSTNNISGSNNSTTYLTQNNIANINNNIYTNANTGYNTANFNNGDITIVTGNIKSAVIISNTNINSNHDLVKSGMSGFSAVVSSNGADSINYISFENNKNIELSKNNIANITNNVNEKLNTGKNYALGNLGDVVISTGDIESYIQIKNENINSNSSVVTCECKEKEKPESPKPTPVPQPNPPTSIVQGASGSAPSAGGPAAGDMLPVTGSNMLWFYLLNILLFAIFLSGLFLRFHPSNGPPSLA